MCCSDDQSSGARHLPGHRPGGRGVEGPYPFLLQVAVRDQPGNAAGWIFAGCYTVVKEINRKGCPQNALQRHFGGTFNDYDIGI